MWRARGARDRTCGCRSLPGARPGNNAGGDVRVIDGLGDVACDAHHLLVDLARFELENSNEVFVPTREPYGWIEAVSAR